MNLTIITINRNNAAGLEKTMQSVGRSNSVNSITQLCRQPDEKPTFRQNQTHVNSVGKLVKKCVFDMVDLVISKPFHIFVA